MKLPPDSVALNDGWSLSYQGISGDDRRVTVPHAWNQDVSLVWEGPAFYTRNLDVPAQGGWLVFEGVSYEAEVTITGLNAEATATHKGIWDAFSLDLSAWSGESVTVQVKVMKNGGETFPVPQVLSGFLPYVFGTFGGIFRPVWFCPPGPDPLLECPRAESPWLRVEGSRLFSQGQPFTPRGVLTWGWHPELGHVHLTPEISRREITRVKELGFNTIKFCLWMPPHFHLEAMAEAGLMAWLELPLWAPADSSKFDFEASEAELLRIVDQYRRHPNVLAWTLGCELSDHTPAEWRRELTEKIRERTGHPLIKDNSGGAEMYGGDPREYGDFEDYHPYCDLPFFGPVLDTLALGPRGDKPTLLGETNDHDCLRDMNALAADRPYWLSSDPFFNAQAVRWQHDFPGMLDAWEGRDLAQRIPSLLELSRRQSLFMRRQVVEEFHARREITGWVITGWSDTPISTAGFVDPEGQPRFTPEEVAPMVMDPAPFLIRDRRPPWVKGGNRPGWQSRHCRWQGKALYRIGLRTVQGYEGEVSWRACSDTGEIWASGSLVVKQGPQEAVQVLEAWIPEEVRGHGRLEVSLSCSSGAVGAVSWPIYLAPAMSKEEIKDLKASCEGQIFFLPGSVEAPFWRESCLDTTLTPFWREKGWEGGWHLWQDIGGEGALGEADLEPMKGLLEQEFLLMRVDTRTYKEDPLLMRAWCPTMKRRVIVTTLRPEGGLGAEPFGLAENPAGCLFLKDLLSLLED